VAEVTLPERKRRKTSSRSGFRPNADKHFQPKNWPLLVDFNPWACGLRREELRDLRVYDIFYKTEWGSLVVQRAQGKGGKDRKVSCLPGVANKRCWLSRKVVLKRALVF